MVKDVFTFLVGGKAGEGVKKAGAVGAQIFIEKGLQIFRMDDYMSLIRGGHNFSVVSTANRKINSHYMKANLSVNSDKRSYDNHIDHLIENGMIIYNSDEITESKGFGIPFTSMTKNYKMGNLMFGIGAVAALAAYIDYSKENLYNVIKKEYKKGIEDNIKYATEIYDIVNSKISNKFSLAGGDIKRPIITGNQAISFGAIAGGLDTYFGYPMTPASSILHSLAKYASDFGLAIVHPESEIAVINMAIGASFAGAKSMVGTSGGGFALMVEGFSLAGITEAPLLIILSMRPGPATGVPTYTEQADLNFALYAGHGDFLRILASPATIKDAFYLTAEMLDLVCKFQTPGILLTEKHLSESAMTVDLDIRDTIWAEFKIGKNDQDYKRYLYTDDGISPLSFPPSDQLIKWNSYEHDEYGFTTEDSEITANMHDKRYRKGDTLKEYMKSNIKTVNIYGDQGPLIFTYGSTTMSVLEALHYGDIKARVIQPVYLSPFPIWDIEQYQNKPIIVVEMSKSGQFNNLLKEKGGLTVKNLINKYDGRAFDPIDLSIKLMEVL
ncbi:MAG: 2-oxoacid:acceptor oxidoreductase subunit alpha [Candidatus Lokiarchaeota archaeon]|nr:2-oxoacid:acceptor oxidoreductase subunit alpha [Candidatus Lokiarchaeota archaeon]